MSLAIVYRNDDKRAENYPEKSSYFLGYTFRPRGSSDRYGKPFINFTLAASNAPKKEMRQKIHNWRMHLTPNKSLEDLSIMFSSAIKGRINYFQHFYKSETFQVPNGINQSLTE